MQQFCPLAAAKQRITLGEPLPFNVRNADRTLLLACGQVIATHEQMEALFSRGALVDMDELKPTPAEQVKQAPREALPAMWEESMDRMGAVLKASVQRDFSRALDEAAKPVLALIEREPDLAIFQIVRQEVSRRAQYGVAHSLHTAIAGQLAAARLGWDKSMTQRLFKAALTMNLSIMELQGRLAMQVTPLSAAQREEIRTHAQRSVAMLRETGVTDEEWLAAVTHHHEEPGKNAARETELSDVACMLRRADIYTAKLSARATRQALAPHDAARSMFLADNGHPMTAALVKEFGIYPPGSCVRLYNGEMGIVVKRGEATNTPVVAALTDRRGDAMMEPLRRNTAVAEHAVVAVIPEKGLKVRVLPEQLIALG